MKKRKIFSFLALNIITVMAIPAISVACGSANKNEQLNTEFNKTQALEQIKNTYTNTNSLFKSVLSGVDKLANSDNSYVEKEILKEFKTKVDLHVQNYETLFKTKVEELDFKQRNYVQNLETIQNDLLEFNAKLQNEFIDFGKRIKTTKNDAELIEEFNSYSGLRLLFNTQNSQIDEAQYFDLAASTMHYEEFFSDNILEGLEGFKPQWKEMDTKANKTYLGGKILSWVVNLGSKHLLQHVANAQFIEKTSLHNSLIESFDKETQNRRTRVKKAAVPEFFRKQIEYFDKTLKDVKTFFALVETKKSSKGVTELNATQLESYNNVSGSVDKIYKAFFGVEDNENADLESKGLKNNFDQLSEQIDDLPNQDLQSVSAFNNLYSKTALMSKTLKTLRKNYFKLLKLTNETSKFIEKLLSEYDAKTQEDYELLWELKKFQNFILKTNDYKKGINQHSTNFKADIFNMFQNISLIASYPQVLLLKASSEKLQLQKTDFAIGVMPDEENQGKNGTTEFVLFGKKLKAEKEELARNSRKEENHLSLEEVRRDSIRNYNTVTQKLTSFFRAMERGGLGIIHSRLPQNRKNELSDFLNLIKPSNWGSTIWNENQNNIAQISSDLKRNIEFFKKGLEKITSEKDSKQNFGDLRKLLDPATPIFPIKDPQLLDFMKMFEAYGVETIFGFLAKNIMFHNQVKTETNKKFVDNFILLIGLMLSRQQQAFFIARNIQLKSIKNNVFTKLLSDKKELWNSRNKPSVKLKNVDTFIGLIEAKLHILRIKITSFNAKHAKRDNLKLNKNSNEIIQKSKELKTLLETVNKKLQLILRNEIKNADDFIIWHDEAFKVQNDLEAILINFGILNRTIFSTVREVTSDLEITENNEKNKEYIDELTVINTELNVIKNDINKLTAKKNLEMSVWKFTEEIRAFTSFAEILLLEYLNIETEQKVENANGAGKLPEATKIE